MLRRRRPVVRGSIVVVEVDAEGEEEGEDVSAGFDGEDVMRSRSILLQHFPPSAREIKSTNPHRTHRITPQTPALLLLPPYRLLPLFPNQSARKYPTVIYVSVIAGATPTKANVNSWDLSSLSMPDNAWFMSTYQTNIEISRYSNKV